VAHRRVTHAGGGRMMTKQAEAAETDINAIIRRHRQMGVPFPQGGDANYGDFSNALDFHSALNRVREAEQTFALLPPDVREFCQNDPGRFLDLVMDPDRRDELVALGLVEGAMPAAAKPAAAPPAPAPPAPAEPPVPGSPPAPVPG